MKRSITILSTLLITLVSAWQLHADTAQEAVDKFVANNSFDMPRWA